MSQPIERRWTVEEFFAWQGRQSERYEFVAGFPIRKMAGASHAHDDIVVNLLGELRDQLRGSGCRPFTGDGAVETRPGQIRRPDAGVDCGRRDANAYTATEPRMVAEVLSPSTRDFDAFGKLDEYKSVPSIAYILLVEPNAPEAVLWARAEDGSWASSHVEGLEMSVDMPALGLSLKLADLYEGIAFPSAPRLAFG